MAVEINIREKLVSQCRFKACSLYSLSLFWSLFSVWIFIIERCTGAIGDPHQRSNKRTWMARLGPFWLVPVCHGWIHSLWISKIGCCTGVMHNSTRSKEWTFKEITACWYWICHPITIVITLSDSPYMRTCFSGQTGLQKVFIDIIWRLPSPMSWSMEWEHLWKSTSMTIVS